MNFAHPLFSLLLIPLALAAFLVFRFLKNTRASLSFPGNPALWQKSGNLRGRAVFWSESALSVMVLILLVFSLMRPQKIESRPQGSGQGIDIMLAVDTSLSMSALDFSPENRLDAAKETAIRFISGRTQDRIGAIVFGGAPQPACPLTSDYGALIDEIRQFSPGMTHTDGTAIGDAIVSAVNHLKDDQAKSKIIVLLTDGRSNTGVIDPITAAKIARLYGIKIYTIGTAKTGQSFAPVDDPLRGRVMVPISDDLDEDLLTQVADMTGGQYFRATSLKKFNDIYDTIDKLEKSETTVSGFVLKFDLYRWPLGAAALLLMMEIFLANTWLLKWP